MGGNLEISEDLNLFFKNNALWIALGVVGVIVVTVIVLLIVNFAVKKDKKPKEEPIALDENKWLEALGGKENIKSADAKGSRLNVVLNDETKLNKDLATELGASSFLKMSNKIIIVVKEHAEDILEKIK